MSLGIEGGELVVRDCIDGGPAGLPVGEALNMDESRLPHLDADPKGLYDFVFVGEVFGLFEPPWTLAMAVSNSSSVSSRLSVMPSSRS